MESTDRLDTTQLVTRRYDEADQTLDGLEFVMCAIAAMENSYSDQVVNGCVSIINDAVVTLREYIGDTRETLLVVASSCTN